MALLLVAFTVGISSIADAAECAEEPLVVAMAPSLEAGHPEAPSSPKGDCVHGHCHQTAAEPSAADPVDPHTFDNVIVGTGAPVPRMPDSIQTGLKRPPRT